MTKNKSLQNKKNLLNKKSMEHAIKLNMQFITDNEGNKKSVILDYQEYQELIEDYQDLLAIIEAQDEPPISLEEAERMLKEDGIL